MRRLNRLWALAALSAVALIAAMFARETSVPKHQGKTVYDWMLETRSSSLEDNKGLGAIGTNAVPYLARALAMRKTPYDRFAFLRHSRVQNVVTNLAFGLRWTKPSAEVRRAAARSLLGFGFEAKPALSQLHAELVSPDAPDRQTVVHCLLELVPPPESIPFLLRAWSLATNEVWVVRHDLLHALGRAGTNAAALAMPIAVTALDDPESDVRSIAANALERWQQPAPDAVPKLIVLLSSTNSSLAAAAAGALGRVTSRADGAIPALRRLLASTNDYTRAVAAMTLWRFGGDANEAQVVLEPLLGSKTAKGMAARYLGSMGSVAHGSVPALLRASHEDIGAWVDIYDRAHCARAVLLIQSESPEAITVLEEALAFQKNPWIRATMANEVGNLGQLALPLIPALRRALQDPDRAVRHEAAEALAKLPSRKPDR